MGTAQRHQPLMHGSWSRTIDETGKGTAAKQKLNSSISLEKTAGRGVIAEVTSECVVHV